MRRALILHEIWGIGLRAVIGYVGPAALVEEDFRAKVARRKEVEAADSLVGEMRDAGFVPGSDFKGVFFLGGIGAKLNRRLPSKGVSCRLHP